jgi:hypothetical protein
LSYRKPTATRVQGLNGLSIHIAHKCFGVETDKVFFKAEVNAYFKTLLLGEAEVGRNLSVKLEPGGLPRSTPCLSKFEGNKVCLKGFLKANWFRNHSVF